MLSSAPPTLRPSCCASPTPTSAPSINRAKTVAAAVQRRDIALLLDGRLGLAARIGADGAHLDRHRGVPPRRCHASNRTASPAPVVCAAVMMPMLAAEFGADYVMFGEPGRRGMSTRRSFDGRRTGKVVGRTHRTAVRRLCGRRRRGQAAGTSRRRLRRARRLDMDPNRRSPTPCRRRPRSWPSRSP